MRELSVYVSVCQVVTELSDHVPSNERAVHLTVWWVMTELSIYLTVYQVMREMSI